MTRTTSFLGSPLYMSPEQMRATKGVDARTDIWSLGVILFELLTGRRPFHAEGVTELAIKVASDPAPALRELRHDAPQGLADVVARCLEKDRTKRFQSVGQLAVALKDFGSKGARISVERVLGTLRGAGVSEAVLPPPERPTYPSGLRVPTPRTRPGRRHHGDRPRREPRRGKYRRGHWPRSFSRGRYFEPAPSAEAARRGFGRAARNRDELRACRPAAQRFFRCLDARPRRRQRLGRSRCVGHVDDGLELVGRARRSGAFGPAPPRLAGGHVPVAAATSFGSPSVTAPAGAAATCP